MGKARNIKTLGCITGRRKTKGWRKYDVNKRGNPIRLRYYQLSKQTIKVLQVPSFTSSK